ncbi:MAG TPA: hypothetical protein VFS47_04795 [Steroidobacteraceae bacterium]|jgi:hypothetical protein|nr:hypothetical protein [Steroidobacteraceae bacterium]
MLNEPQSASYQKALGAVLLVGAVALLAAPAARRIYRRWRLRHPEARTEEAIDDQLMDTFPASDPIAPRYVDIPVNRR